MALREFIVQGFGADEEYPLGYFLCQPVDSAQRDQRKISFALRQQENHVALFFDPELLCYVLIIDSNNIDPPYKPLDGSF